MPDWGPGLAQLGLQAEDWGPMYRGTYAELLAGWRGAAPCPGAAELQAASDAAAAAAAAETARLTGIKDDPLQVNLLNQLKTATAAQIAAYVDANVVDLPSARTMLKRIVLVLAAAVRVS